MSLQDLFALDLEPYRYSGVNMTGFRLLNTDSSQVASVVERWAMERLQAPSKAETGMMEGMMTVSLSRCLDIFFSLRVLEPHFEQTTYSKKSPNFARESALAKNVINHKIKIIKHNLINSATTMDKNVKIAVAPSSMVVETRDKRPRAPNFHKC